MKRLVPFVSGALIVAGFAVMIAALPEPPDWFGVGLVMFFNGGLLTGYALGQYAAGDPS